MQTPPKTVDPWARDAIATLAKTTGVVPTVPDDARLVHTAARRATACDLPSTVSRHSGPLPDADVFHHKPGAPYDFTGAMVRAVTRFTTLPVFEHVRPENLLCSFTQCRTGSEYGWYAKVVPLRFENGKSEKIVGRYRWVWPTFVVEGMLKLYLVSFYLPRFLSLDFDEKVQTVVHELYHISPLFNGDLRRFRGKNYAHGHSRKAYDEALAPVCDEAKRALRLADFDFFALDHTALRTRYTGVTGTQFHGLSPQRMERY